MRYHIDFETFSEADLRTVGAYRYASDPSTQILLLAIASDVEGPYLWVHPNHGEGDPRAWGLMVAMCADGEAEIWAHNAQFEWAIMRYRWRLDVGLDRPKRPQMRCSAALARCAGLPPSLGALAMVLGLAQQKDTAGSKLIALLCLPGKDGRVLPADRFEEFKQLGRYCLQDVRTEKAVHTALEPFQLRGRLLDIWLFDLKLNDNGLPVNVPALEKAQWLIDELTPKLTQAFRDLTGLNPTQRAKVKMHLLEHGVDLPDMKADTLEEALEKPQTRHVRKVLETYAEVQFSAVKKVRTMLDCVCADGWVRGTHLFHGAGTGRWSGRLIQPQNFKRPLIKDADTVYAMICEGRNAEEIAMVFGNPLAALANCIRNFIHWGQGGMIDADYSAIEARIVCWLAGQGDVLMEYRAGVDQYIKMAAVIYGVSESTIKNPSDEREVGKRAVLGCGFQMAAPKFKKSCKDQYGIMVSDTLAEKAVAGYRERHNLVRKLWFSVERAAANAIRVPGTVFLAGKLLKFWVHTHAGMPFLFMRLPSGRKIAYPQPQLLYDRERDKDRITFLGEVKGGHWGRVTTYGGKLVENATQGVAFDIMGHGACNADAQGFTIVMLVHDQAPALHLPGQTVEKYVQALTDLPPWAEGLPIVAQGRYVPYYKK